MFRKIAFSAVVAMSSIALAAPDAKDDLTSAAKKLADASNYSWKTSSEGGFGGGNQEGKTEKGGVTLISITLGDNQVQVATKGQKSAIKTEDGWKTAEELGGGDGQPGPGMFIARMVQSFKAPGAQAEEYASKLKEVKKDGDVLTAQLSGADANAVIPSFGGRRGRGGAGGGGGGGQQPPQMQNTKLELKFWTKDGVLTKYSYHLTGSISIGGEDRDIDRTTTVEVSDIGSTKVELPDEAKKKLE